eukprot:g26500.t1
MHVLDLFILHVDAYPLYIYDLHRVRKPMTDSYRLSRTYHERLYQAFPPQPWLMARTRNCIVADWYHKLSTKASWSIFHECIWGLCHSVPRTMPSRLDLVLGLAACLGIDMRQPSSRCCSDESFAHKTWISVLRTMTDKEGSLIFFQRIYVAAEAYLKPTNTGSYDYFGIEVSVSGNTLVVGAVGEDSCATGINGNGADNSCDGEGAAYVFNISAEVACPAFSAGAGVLSGCTCIAGYQGHIQTSASWPYYVGACIKLDECLARPCMHGNCTELVGNYSCECESGWAGRNCSLNIDECAQKPVGPCAEGSRCLDTPGSFLCTVSPVFKAPLQVPAGTNLSRVPPGTTLRFEVQGSLWKVMVKNVSFDAGSRLVACILPSSFTGMQLHFAVRSCFPFNATGDGTDPGCHTFQWSPVQLILLPKTTPFLFAAPPPRLSPGTLRLYLTPAPGSTTLTLPSNLQFLVTYGPWTCQPTSDSTAERVVCQTELYSAGAYQFVVTVDGQLGQGTDTLIVPPGATLESLSGCRFTTDKSVNGKRLQGTSGCSTEGGTVLTLRGQDLVTGALVPQILVNSQLCRPLQIDGKAFEAGGLNLTQLLTCEMPAGTGAGAVSIFNGKAFSRLFPLVEYAVPFITKLEAPECIQASPLSLTDCPRQGFDLTIVGVAFGAESASVLVGRWECSDVRHGNGLEAHSRLQCRVPPGSGQSLSVRVEQHDGFRSQGEPGFVSTKECEPPFHLPSDSLECAVCPPGTEAPAVGSRSCKPCPENTWRNQPNQMQCEVCQLGKISADGLSCICPAKLFESRGPGLLCLPCLAGAICEHPGTNASNMLAREGWFKLDQLLLDTDANMDPDFYMCPGGASVCLAANKCAPTLTGPFCTQCQPGLYSWGSLSCGPCRAWRLYLALALAGLLLYALFLRVVSESASGSGVIKIIFFFIATAQEMLGPRYRWLSWLAFLNFEAQSSTSEICFAPLSPTQRLAFNAFFPLLMFVLLLCIGLVEYWWKQRTQGRFVWATYSRTFCAVLLLSYSRVSKGVISYFDCDKIGPYFLITDHPAVDCSSEGYRKLRPFMLLLCLFPVALLPVCIGLYLLRHRAALGNPAPSAELSHAKEFFGPLFETYNASNFLFEPLAIFRRTLLITFAVVIDDPLERAEYLFMLQLACLSLQMYLHPFRTAQDNGLEAMCLLCLVSIAGLNTGLLDKEVLPFGVQVLVSLLVLGPICRALFLFSRAKFESWRLTRLDTDPASPRGSALDVLYSVTNLAALAGPSFLWKKSSASAAKVAAEGDVEIHTSPARRDKSGARESKEESAHEQPLGQSVADPYGEILAQDDAEDAVPLYEPQTDEQDEWSRNQPRNVESASSTNEQGG